MIWDKCIAFSTTTTTTMSMSWTMAWHTCHAPSLPASCAPSAPRDPDQRPTTAPIYFFRYSNGAGVRAATIIRRAASGHGYFCWRQLPLATAFGGPYFGAQPALPPRRAPNLPFGACPFGAIIVMAPIPQ